MKKIFIMFYLLISVYKLYSQIEWHYLTFSFWEIPTFLNERENFLSDEYTLIKTKNVETNEFRIMEGRDFNDYILVYSDKYIDTTVIIHFVKVFGECVDTMKLIFKPFEMKNRFYVIENLYIKIPFLSGVYNINLPESLTTWQELKSELAYMPKKYKYKYIYQKNIAEFQDWSDNWEQRNKEELEAYEKRYNTFDQHISFKIYDTMRNTIKPGNQSYDVSWTFAITWCQTLNLKWLQTGLTYDSTNRFYTIVYHDEMWEHDELILFIKGDTGIMEISFRPNVLKHRKCSTAEVFIDSIIYKPGKYEVTVPNKVYWNNIKTIHFSGYDKDFYDLTPFQKWRE